LETFPRFVDLVLAGDRAACESIPGILTLRNVSGARRRPSSGAERDIDEFVMPDYSDFVSAFDRSQAAGRVKPMLFFETSRGCWWGERAHCTFCGLNGLTMRYRTMSPRLA